ncbi:hypothetical protein V5E97_39975 [Singulisphaera sp. Ch08]|uniref:HEAT repeat domain-containing protein n=1 Tax=Singulisphaera sp. Ch08 TaxID=3120278 RepID=A0AAU7CHL0_9BACT
MISALLICTGWLAAAPVILPDAEGELASYEAAKASVGRDPESQIKLALWCESHGLQAERIKHLAIAVMTDPKNATARGLMGLVAYRGRWQRPEAVGKSVEADDQLKASLERYHEKRLEAPYTAEGQWKLALWCDENDLKSQARAHLMAVTSLDPARDQAWKRLGYKKVDGRWVSAGQLAAEATESKRQKEADGRWKSILERARGALASKNRQVDAEETLAQVTDPRAVPTICRVFSKGEANQNVAIRLLGQIDSASSSRALAALAVGSPFAEVRRAAAETLVRRDPRDFAGWLANLLRKPVRFEVRPVGGPGSPGELFVEGTQFNVKRLYSPPAGPTLRPGDQLGLNDAGLPVATRFLGLTQRRMSPAEVQMLEGKSSNVKQVLAQFPKNGLAPEAAQKLEQLLEGSWSIPIFERDQQVANSRNYSAIVPQLAQIPVGEMVLEAQAAARMAERQLESDVASSSNTMLRSFKSTSESSPSSRTSLEPISATILRPGRNGRSTFGVTPMFPSDPHKKLRRSRSRCRSRSSRKRLRSSELERRSSPFANATPVLEAVRWSRPWRDPAPSRA